MGSSLLSFAQFLLMYLTMVAVAGWVSSNNKVGTHSCQRLVGGGGIGMEWTVLCCLPSNSFSMYLTMVAVAGWVSGNNKVGTHVCQRLVGDGGGGG